ncbi:nitrile hydratase subunit alpha [Nocardioides aequoreus]|uniref:nitrile hydratase subunit alpha n=1 Tax=Nocardioides aequoreus TaxID=397278 RepID=UPI0012F6E78A|nr:nitrile hydratase subunit alpha [Nocardioides aequoreus]
MTEHGASASTPSHDGLAGGSAHTQIHDPEGHVTAVETDFEYFRRKRLESRVLHFLRRGIITFADLLRADSPADAPAWRDRVWKDADGPIRHVEDQLDELVRGIATVSVPHSGAAPVAIDETRKERGDYDEFFRIATRGLGAGTLEERLERLDAELADSHRLLRAFTHAMLARGRITSGQLEERRRQLTTINHHNGARIVARAWLDPDFKQRLLETGRAAVPELDIPPGKLGRLGVAENTDEQHNTVVCTLCSCYPHDLLGNPPWWYRTDEYKERIVRSPRETIRDMFALAIPDDVRVRVHDSTSDVRWMVLPQRPPGTEGLDEDALAALVTAESLVGAALVPSPEDQPGDARG